MKKLNHIFILPDADRRHAKRQYLTDLFKQSSKKFEKAINGFPNEGRFSQYEFLELEDRIEQFVKTGKDPQDYKDSEDLLDSNKIQIPLDYLIKSYTKGGQVFDNIIKYILDNDVCNVLSIYALQKRNLGRSDDETYAMLNVEPEFFRGWAKDKQISSQCNFKFVGNRKIFDLHKQRPRLKELIKRYINAMDNLEAKALGEKLKVYVLTPYDAEWEINQAVVDGKFKPENLVVKEPVDLIIRAGNAKTPISGGLPYQTQFAQFDSVTKYFPDFTIDDFQGVLDNYGAKDRESGL